MSIENQMTLWSRIKEYIKELEDEFDIDCSEEEEKK